MRHKLAKWICKASLHPQEQQQVIEEIRPFDSRGCGIKYGAMNDVKTELSRADLLLFLLTFVTGKRL
jgi:hypothetical protein